MDQCIAFSISLIPEPSPRVNHDRIIFRLVRPALGGLETSFRRAYQRGRSANCSTYGPKSTWKTRIQSGRLCQCSVNESRPRTRGFQGWRAMAPGYWHKHRNCGQIGDILFRPFPFLLRCGDSNLDYKSRGHTGSKLDWTDQAREFSFREEGAKRFLSWCRWNM